MPLSDLEMVIPQAAEHCAKIRAAKLRVAVTKFSVIEEAKPLVILSSIGQLKSNLSVGGSVR